MLKPSGLTGRSATITTAAAPRLTLPTDQSRPWMRYAGMIESGDARSSQRTDDIVYGQKD